MAKLIFRDVTKEPLICVCENHEGNREFMTTYIARKGQKIYCDKCRNRYKEQKKREAQTISTNN